MNKTIKYLRSKRTDEQKSESGMSYLYSRYKSGARKRGLAWCLTKNEFKSLTSSYCYYCGDEPQKIARNYTYNGIDRLNNYTGYIESNVVPCCYKCNMMKGTQSENDFISQAKKISIHQLS